MNFLRSIILAVSIAVLLWNCGSDSEAIKEVNKAEEANKRTKAILSGEAFSDTVNQVPSDTVEVSQDSLN